MSSRAKRRSGNAHECRQDHIYSGGPNQCAIPQVPDPASKFAAIRREALARKELRRKR